MTTKLQKMRTEMGKGHRSVYFTHLQVKETADDLSAISHML